MTSEDASAGASSLAQGTGWMPRLEHLAGGLALLLVAWGGYITLNAGVLPIDPALAPRAIGVGFAGGFAGGLIAGAIGLISVPLIVLFLGFPIHLAVGTNLFQTIFTAAGGAWQHGRLNNVNTRLAVPILLGAALGAPLGALVSVRLPASVLLWIFSFILVGMALRMGWEALFPKKGDKDGFHLQDLFSDDTGTAFYNGLSRVTGKRVADKLTQAFADPIQGTFKGHAYRVDRVTPVLLGAGVGFVAGLLGIGGGFLITPLIALLLNVGVHLAVGTGLVVITGNSLFGSVPHLLHGNVALTAGLLIAAGGMVGAALGSRLSDRLSERALYGLFTVLLVAVTWKMVPL